MRANELRSGFYPTNDNWPCSPEVANPSGGAESAALYYLHTDHLGKPQFATDAAGAVVWDAGTATPFGDGVQLASAFTQRLQFPGQYYDEETGTSHNHHRTYDPALGRYLQSDPIGLAGGINRYAYVGGNPMGAVDPMGLKGILTIFNEGPSAGNTGHSWLEFIPIGKPIAGGCDCNASTTYGTWPTQKQNGNPRVFQGSLKINYDATKSKKPTQSRSVMISDAQERVLMRMVRAYQSQNGKTFSGTSGAPLWANILTGDYLPAWSPTHACTGFASNTWNNVTGENLSGQSRYISSTRALGKSIKNANGGRDYSSGSLMQTPWER